MAYIGNIPAEKYSAFQKQDFTTSATTSYTLDNPVANANELALFINFVRQEPTTAYSASGTTLTLTSATASSDDMYCVYLGKAVQTVNPPNNSVGSAQLSPIAITGQTAETSIATDDTILIHDTSASALRKMTRANFVSGISNTPAFASYLNSDVSVTYNTWIKMVCDVEDYDSNSAYDTSNGRFTVPSGQAGKYVFSQTTTMQHQLAYLQQRLYINGTARFRGTSVADDSSSTLGAQYSIDLAEGDYVEFYFQQNRGTQSLSGLISSTVRACYVSGFKLMGV